jgi:hypothetical protein
MELVLSSETVTINGKTIPKIYGGFGPGQPAILAKQVAEIHGYEVKRINELVNNNLDWFDEGIDYLDLKKLVISRASRGVVSNDPSGFLIKSGFYPTTQALGGAKYIYLFSQQGYALLCKLLKSDLAKQIYKQMVRDYFQIVEVVSQLSLHFLLSVQKAALEIAEGFGLKGNQSVLFANRLLKEKYQIDLLEMGGQTALISEDQEPDYNATTLGKTFLDGISGRKVNQLLEKAGLIYSYRDNKGKIQWDATEKGKPYVIWKDTGKKHSNGTPVKQLLYKKSMVDMLKQSEF